MIEAMACGTPTIAFRNGSVPEIIEDGVGGFIVDSVEAAVNAVERVGFIDRQSCRAAFESRFTSQRMARDYLRIYNQTIGHREQSGGGPELVRRGHGKVNSSPKEPKRTSSG
jgi:glycosyltransferase involved in cell wall biosynthesis